MNTRQLENIISAFVAKYGFLDWSQSYIKTTDSRGGQYKFDNLIAGTQVQEKNHVIVGDITYYQNASGLYYIFHFIDYYNLEVKGLLGSKNMESINAEKCLR